ncbi:MAG: transcriptional regulator, partial [Clostridia bacterium]|nr:transcriptional regulator [Clostridia bacterium]
LMGMDKIRAAKTLYDIHDQAHRAMGAGAFPEAEKIYREALLIYPTKPEMLLGLSSVLAMQGAAGEAIPLAEKGISLSDNEKQKATMRAVLCFLYLQIGERERALDLASSLPHVRESREEVVPKLQKPLPEEALAKELRLLILGA